MQSISSIVVGTHVWVEDPEVAWLDGEVVETKGDEITINCTSGTKVVAKASNVYPKDTEAPLCGVDDMTKLSYLHEPGVLYNLKCRYDSDEIYTYTGNILIAVNPFKRLPDLYAKHIMQKYKGVALGELSPHPFAIADSAYRQMINDEISQSILVSGESGAGKTESTKMLMNYLAYMGGRSENEGRSVEQQVLESNPVLEAFGNAKTVRNNNSSRFGKFVEIQFDKRGRISGAAIRTYLLERSRVCQVSDPERNYHCFYMLCAAPPEDVEKYKLGNPRKFHYLNQSSFFELDGVDESKEYLATRRAMEVVGISSDEQDAIFRVVAAILHLGNVEFAKGKEIDSAKPKDDESRFHLKTVAELFMCNEKLLEDALIKRIIVTRDEKITKCLDPQAATTSRDALAKTVYSKLFDWLVAEMLVSVVFFISIRGSSLLIVFLFRLVEKINNSIGQDPDSQMLIGVLDIYGFESFKTNSFEQFCINLTNEKLQQHFNQHVFKMEQEEYTKEEIDWSYIEFVDNQDILDLIEKKPGGIIALLDEACMFPRSTHETFSEKLYQTFRDNKRFIKPKLSRTDFTIVHYAGEVTYQTDLFLDKNKDYVVAEYQDLLSASRCSFISGLFPPLPEESSKTSKFSSIGTRFKQQLQSLLETLNATEPHYIRCVKPNNLLKPAIFENQNVLQQLRCGGVMEAIRISCAGFPTRRIFDEFFKRFNILLPEVKKGSCDGITASKKVLEKVGLKGYQIGKTKVFLRAGQMAELDAHRNEVLGRCACTVQRKVRTYFKRKMFLLLRDSATKIQAICRGQLARNFYEWKRRDRASLMIGKCTRMFLARKDYKLLCSSAVSIQTVLRRMAARNELNYRRRRKAAIAIQTHCRGFLAHLHYRRMKKAALATQCAWRMKIAKRELRKLKMAAKEAAALQAALEKQVEDLSIQVEFEKRMRADMEEAKTKENVKLQSSLEEMRHQLQEAKELVMKESEKVKEFADKEEAKTEENVKLQSALEAKGEENVKLQSDLEAKGEENVKLQSDLEAKGEENVKLQSSLEEMRVQFQETKELLMREQEKTKELADTEEAKTEENVKLQSSLEEMRVQFQETKELLMREQEKAKELADTEEAKTEENVKLQSALEEMRLQYQETKELLMREQEKTKELADTEEAKTEENVKLQSALEEMRLKYQESEEAKELLMKECEKEKENAEKVSVVQEVPVIDNEMVNKLTAENEQLKASAEAKTQENAKLQSSLEETQHQLQETKALLLTERETRNRTADEMPVVQEVKVTDHEKLNEPTAQNELLKVDQDDAKTQENVKLHATLRQLQQATELLLKRAREPEKNADQVSAVNETGDQMPVLQDGKVDHEIVSKLTAENLQLKALVSELEKKNEEANKLIEEQLKQIVEAESKIIEEKTEKQRLKEKVSDLETEEHIIRQQALLNSQSNRRMSGRFSVATQSSENGHQDPQATSKTFASLSLRRSQIERQRESVDILIKYTHEDLGFSEGKPVAAFTIYRCLIQWKSFEAERTNVFDRLIQIIGSAIEDEANNNQMTYWLSNTSTLLFLLQHTLRATTVSTPHKPPQPTSFFGRMFSRSSFSSSSLPVGGLDAIRQVEAKYPALLFKQQLTAYMEKIYGIIRDNFKKELSSALSSCIQAPTESGGENPWKSITENLNRVLNTMNENYVPAFLVQNMMVQIFSYLNVQLFNSILQQKERCTFSTGEYIKAGLDELELWCGNAQEEIVGSCWDEMRHIKETAGFLVMNDKAKVTYDDLITDLCPILSSQQLYRLCTLCSGENDNTGSVSEDVISSIKILISKEESDDVENAFMLEDNPSIPFSVEELSHSLRDMNFTGVKPAAKVAEQKGFEFLRE
ncbi:PREDICTED: myosin-6-like [Ipomoea nil]|uniref:myosin-6-like n=1 Tax=Ipomoea nil TaxID=35883 RepID=UPI00090119A9|nr:PREDICTED: myosin-6-like [Ipomoea nil]